jgi:hypothetical protein
MPRSAALFSALISALSAIAIAQKQPAPARPQTPRQALIEMITKGGDSVLKHLTVEVQEMLLQPENKASAPFIKALTSMKPENGLKAFEAGDVLFSYNDPGQHVKYEVQVDNDDLAGTEDTLLLSLHVFRDGKEEDTGFGLMSPHFSISMKQQQSIWRLDKISVGADLPVGNPEFLEKTFFRNFAGESTGIGIVPGWHESSSATPTQPASIPPEQVVTTLAFAEAMFARQHPETGFTCSLAELAETAKLMGVDSQVSRGSYNGYRFAIAGCEGKPAASFQITAEPITVGSGTKAYCTDATQNVRVLEGASAANCLAFGRVQAASDEGGVGWDPVSVRQPEPHKDSPK